MGAAIVTGYKGRARGGAEGRRAGGDGRRRADGSRRPRRACSPPWPAARRDYTKGNRLRSGEAWKIIPRHRYLGNAALSFATKIASGYWHVADSQSGYTAVTSEALALLQLDRLYPRYGFPNHLLVELNIYDFRVRDVPIRPVYNVGEVSGIRLPKVIPTLSWLLFKCYFWRMKEKYVIRDFHPLVFFLTSSACCSVGVGLRARLARGRAPPHGERDPGGDDRPRRPARRSPGSSSCSSPCGSTWSRTRTSADGNKSAARPVVGDMTIQRTTRFLALALLALPLALAACGGKSPRRAEASQPR